MSPLFLDAADKLDPDEHHDDIKTGRSAAVAFHVVPAIDDNAFRVNVQVCSLCRRTAGAPVSRVARMQCSDDH